MLSRANKKRKQLTARLLEVLKLFAEGLINKQVADRLHVHYETIRTHRKKIVKLLEAKNITEACCIAIREGWI